MLVEVTEPLVALGGRVFSDWHFDRGCPRRPANQTVVSLLDVDDEDVIEIGGLLDVIAPEEHAVVLLQGKQSHV